jgi:hypothetical protein
MNPQFLPEFNPSRLGSPSEVGWQRAQMVATGVNSLWNMAKTLTTETDKVYPADLANLPEVHDGIGLLANLLSTRPSMVIAALRSQEMRGHGGEAIGKMFGLSLDVDTLDKFADYDPSKAPLDQLPLFGEGGMFHPLWQQLKHGDGVMMPPGKVSDVRAAKYFEQGLGLVYGGILRPFDGRENLGFFVGAAHEGLGAFSEQLKRMADATRYYLRAMLGGVREAFAPPFAWTRAQAKLLSVLRGGVATTVDLSTGHEVEELQRLDRLIQAQQELIFKAVLPTDEGLRNVSSIYRDKSQPGSTSPFTHQDLTAYNAAVLAGRQWGQIYKGR